MGGPERFRTLVLGAVAVYRPGRIVHVSIDGWFDTKWLGFMGKVLGVAGANARREDAYPLPPFNVHRVLAETHLKLGPDGWVVGADARPLHREEQLWRPMGGPDNFHQCRTVEAMIPAGTMLTWCGCAEGACSLMVYTTTDEGLLAWYVSIDPEGRRRSKGITERELGMLEQRADVAAAAALTGFGSSRVGGE